MKTIRLFLFTAVSAAALFWACNDHDPIQNPTPSISESVALRTAVNEMKQANSGRPAARTEDSVFCFNFVYPFTVSYNTGTTISIASFGGLLEVILAETPNHYLTGIAYPFQVQQEGALVTIDNEAEFTALLVECGFNTLNVDLDYSYCFDLVFPITGTINGQTVTITTEAELHTYLSNPANAVIGLDFPISATYQGQVIAIDNLYELYELINQCDGCICTQEYAPVCVQTATGIVEFGNFCYAQCAGYSQNDLVPCNPTQVCSISNLTVVVGDCTATGSYALTVDFTATNPGNTQFQVHTNTGVLVGTYNLSALPLTIPNYPSNNQMADYLTVNIVGNDNCTAVQQWATPACGCPCPTNVDPVCVQTATGQVQYNNFCLAQCAGYTQADLVSCGPAPYNFGTLLGTCFTLQYPVFVQYGGSVHISDTNGHLLQFWNPTVSPMPIFNYPVTATFGSTTVSINSQAEFEALIAQHCN